MENGTAVDAVDAVDAVNAVDAGSIIMGDDSTVIDSI